ncbi:D-cysteine desulfhydrase, partial [Klebsiella pneumoniae]
GDGGNNCVSWSFSPPMQLREGADTLITAGAIQ